jgi:hypothetical protein
MAEVPIPTVPFKLSPDSYEKPSKFEIVFLMEETIWRYGFSVDQKRVHSEWLFYTPNNKEVALFSRDGDDIDYHNRRFKEGKGIKEKTRKNALFLSVVAQFNGEIAGKVISWFGNLKIITGLEDPRPRQFTHRLMERETIKTDIVAFIKKLDTGIGDIRIEKVPLEIPSGMPETMKQGLEQILSGLPKPQTWNINSAHTSFDLKGCSSSVVWFDFNEEESAGTQRILDLAAAWISTLVTGGTIIIDELDVRLHPQISRTIVGLFNSKDTNPLGAQLVFTTHDTSLLENRQFRRDQIWFVEKDNYGSSHLYSLAEYKDVRNDASFEKDYIRGKYGAIPFITGDFQDLISKSIHEVDLADKTIASEEREYVETV